MLLAVVASLVSNASAENITPQRLEAFFRKHKVVKPAYYATLIVRKIDKPRHRKVMAAILIPETRGRAHLVSSEGAVGPWQLHPCWFSRYGRARRPANNLEACYDVFLVHLEESGSLYQALTAYAGGSKWYASKVIKLMKEI